jgi:hypothetical protein
MFDMVRERVEEFMTHVATNSIGAPPNHFTDDEGKKLWLRSKKLDIVLKNCIEAAKRRTFDPFDIECGLNMWIHKNKTYIIPICPNFISRNLTMPAWCEDYCYWDNTDWPEGMTSREWNARRKNWENVCLQDHNATRLYHSVIEAKGEYDLYDLSYKIVKYDLCAYLDKKENA